jgi:glycosyltransferase involved in cell wall biosynthesis
VTEWGVPSQRFVRDLVTATTATRPVVACQRLATNDERPPVRIRCKPAVLDRGGRRAELAWLASVAKLERADLLHAHLGYWAGTVGRVAHLVHRPWVLSLHGHDLLVRARSLADPSSWTRADLVIVPSRFLAEAAVEFGIDAGRVRVIPSGIDLTRISFATRAPGADGAATVLFVGRFVAKKGALDAARAVATVAREHPFLRARFVGYGEQWDDVTAALASLGDRAEVVDGRARGAVERALATCHLLVSPSRTAADGDAETLSVVNLEAQAAGLPVLTTRHGGIPEAVTPESAVLVDEGDQDALVSALASLVDDPSRWPAMGAAGRRNVEDHFDVHARTAEVEGHYIALIDRR